MRDAARIGMLLQDAQADNQPPTVAAVVEGADGIEEGARAEERREAAGHSSHSAARMRSATSAMRARSPGVSPQLIKSPSLICRGKMWRWKWSTDCAAPGPFDWTRLSPSGLSAVFTAFATLMAGRAAPAKASGVTSNTVGEGPFEMPGQCPPCRGLRSMKASDSRT